MCAPLFALYGQNLSLCFAVPGCTPGIIRTPDSASWVHCSRVVVLGYLIVAAHLVQPRNWRYVSRIVDLRQESSTLRWVQFAAVFRVVHRFVGKLWVGPPGDAILVLCPCLIAIAIRPVLICPTSLLSIFLESLPAALLARGSHTFVPMSTPQLAQTAPCTRMNLR